MIDRYDPETCTTAGELRRAGMPIDERIPNCAWAPLSELRDSRGSRPEVMAWGADGPGDPSKSASTSISIDYIKFKWFEINAGIPGSELVAEVGEAVAI